MMFPEYASCLSPPSDTRRRRADAYQHMRCAEEALKEEEAAVAPKKKEEEAVSE